MMTEEFTFTLTFALPQKDMDRDAILDAIFMGGLDDAVVGIGVPGCVGLSLTREGLHAEDVIADTSRAARKTLPQGTRLIRIEFEDSRAGSQDS